MPWKRVYVQGGREGALEVDARSGSVIGPAKAFYLVPEEEAPKCCVKLNVKVDVPPDEIDPQEGSLVVPADHVDKVHPEMLQDD